MKQKETTNEITLSLEEIQNAVVLATEAATKKINQNSENQKSITSKQGNELSELMPGYLAPMVLDSSSLDKYKKREREMVKSEASTSSITRINTRPNEFQSKNFKLGKPDPSVILKKESSAGSGWFGFEAAENTSNLKADISIIRNRNYIDSKKFYKSSDFAKKGNKFMVQVGTVIEGSMESIHTNRLSKKQRTSNFHEEVMQEVYSQKADYVKRKFRDIQKEKETAVSKSRGRMKKKQR
mmetsp:Transcript_24327/g.29926  ORF Transcript_24327/g.29926 Transcript_24327/m.29926 type:complete len:240 (-) Transcript_24327:78-797(-)